jgi:tetratricopeptide (TPR) repeat protein
MKSRDGERKQLEEAFGAYERALTLGSADRSEREMFLENLVHGLNTQYAHSGDLDDLEQAIHMYHEALSRASQSERAAILVNLGDALREKADQSRSLVDLEQAVQMYDEALSLAPKSERTTILSNLATAYRQRYILSGKPADLDQAIGLFMEALSLAPQSELAAIFGNLANTYRQRYTRTGNLADLDQAILLFKEALSLAPKSGLVTIFSGLANTYRQRYTRTGNLADLDQASGLIKESLLLAPNSFPGQRLLFSVLRSSMQNQADVRTISIKDPHERALTPGHLTTSLGPFLSSIDKVQQVINVLHGREPGEIQVLVMSGYSPLSVSVQGGAEAIEAVKGVVIPWQREHAKTMTRLQEQEKQIGIELRKAEILEKLGQAAIDRIEARKQLENVANMKLEHEKTRLELQRAKIQLTLDFMDHLAPNLPETEKITYLIQLLPSLDFLIASELEFEVE